MTDAELRRIARLIDHTLLAPDATRDRIERLCGEAEAHAFIAVCVNPCWVALCARRLSGSTVRVCTVAGFPLGAGTTDVKRCEARRAIADGAAEVDMVMNVGALKSGDSGLVQREIEAVAHECHERRAAIKVILETALLTEEEKVAACHLATAAGADFVKTSTGFGPGGATPADVALMRRTVGGRLGVKASGGVQTLDALLALVAAGGSRIGTSAGVAILEEARRRPPQSTPLSL